MAAGTIVGAIIAVAGSLISGLISSADAEDARNEAIALEKLRRKDEMARFNAEERLAKAKLGLSKEELIFQKREAKEMRKERAYERGVMARKQSTENTINLINSNQALRSNFLNFFQRRRAA